MAEVNALPLAHRYTLNLPEIDWNDERASMSWARHKLAGNDLVYLAWADDTKPHKLDYIKLKEQPTRTIEVRWDVIPCPADRVEMLRQMLLAPLQKR